MWCCEVILAGERGDLFFIFRDKIPHHESIMETNFSVLRTV